MSYFHSQTTALETSRPVPPSHAHAAQIPLQSFTLPNFPPEAFTSGLTSLILTADIKLDEYTSLLTQPFVIPSLPSSITSLTLELFSLGYPPGFLKELGARLGSLKSLTVYSGLLSGTTGESRGDATAFLDAQKGLKELHLLDVFGPKGFFHDLSHALTPTIAFLEISFTYRHSDTAFLNTLPSGAELCGFVKSDLVGLTMRIAEPEVVEEDEDDREGTEEGIMAAQRTDGEEVVQAILAGGKNLKVLDLTMFEVGEVDITKILKACKELQVLSLSTALEGGWEKVFDVLISDDGVDDKKIEVLELVGVPGVDLVERIKREGEPGVNQQVLQKIERKWKRLKSVKISILRTEVELWARESEGWEKKAFE